MLVHESHLSMRDPMTLSYKREILSPKKFALHNDAVREKPQRKTRMNRKAGADDA